MFGPAEMQKVQEVLQVVDALMPMGAPVLDKVFEVVRMLGEAFDRSELQQFGTNMTKKKFDQLMAVGFTREESLLIILNAKNPTAGALSGMKLPSFSVNKPEAPPAG